MKNIPIVFSFDDNYVVPAAVAFYSLLNKAKQGVFYEMYVLHSDISAENQALLHGIIQRRQNASLNFINTGDFLQAEWGNGSFVSNINREGQFTTDTIVICFISRFLSQYDKVICSDVDIVVVDDISELYDINLDGKYIGAVKNAFMKHSSYELSHLSAENYEKFKDSYFGGGIWLLNLKKIREDKLEDRMLEIVADKSIIKRWPDQDIMNLACDNKVEFIALNYISYPYMHSLLQNPAFVSHYTRDELYDSIISPKIIHYAGVKPWSNSEWYLAQIWWQIFDYLQLPKTSIMKNAVDVTKAYKRYKRLTALLFALLVVYTIVFVICF